MRKQLIRLNNWITRLRHVRVTPDQLLLLAPHCLQKHTCERNVTMDVNRCVRCGQCDVGGLLELRDRYQINCCLASGGREAVKAVRDPAIKAVIAVACDKELAEGIRASLPKPVLAITNVIPGKPCFDTRVDLDRVEAGIQSLLSAPSATETTSPSLKAPLPECP